MVMFMVLLMVFIQVQILVNLIQSTKLTQLNMVFINNTEQPFMGKTQVLFNKILVLYRVIIMEQIFMVKLKLLILVFIWIMLLLVKLIQLTQLNMVFINILELFMDKQQVFIKVFLVLYRVIIMEQILKVKLKLLIMVFLLINKVL